MPTTANKPLTQAEIEWFDSPITVQVEPDNQRWLDAMMEMKPDELRSYAVFQYQIPRDAVDGASRDSIMQLVVLANRQGGGGSVVRARYRYIPGLKGILPAAITSRRGRLLYLTRGNENSLQVFSTQTEEWIALSTLSSNARPLSASEQRRMELSSEKSDGFANEFSPAGQKALERSQEAPKPQSGQQPVSAPSVAQDAANDAQVGDPTGAPGLAPAINIPPEVLPRMTRDELAEVATKLGAQDVSEDKFPNKQSLIDYVTTGIEAQAGSTNASPEGADA